MSGFLLDANLSPETRLCLIETFGLDVIDLVTLGLATLDDFEVVALAQREGRVIIMFDLDYGGIYIGGEYGPLGVILLRLSNQTIGATNQALDRFLRFDAATLLLDRALVVIDAERTRAVRSG